ncbi:AraC family transcriptional regulator [Komagataeibacter sp. FNDCF1]|uniref:AraC family transcriptional regulator n=1 Tax=Komagataeibacter sp. FNDCF1 TaxID=2878681 RepID=UPI001E5622FD|nr:AraC family transcriptional regulator [Komagataeibacter sp. FNDCF1]MCE2564635.1 helix-turn-helix domain-containing protein [Komagataeibacter sp. FNDCF1]
MTGNSTPQALRVVGILQWIEENLHEPLSVERISQHAGLSAYHFSRLFTAHTGRSVMAHVRHRRLVQAVQCLAATPDVRLVDLAFDSGFDSQEAFIRAFSRTFGSSPGRVQRAYWQAYSGRAKNLPNTPEDRPHIERIPGHIYRKSFTIAGLAHHFEERARSAIPGLWRRLSEFFPNHLNNVEAYGVMSCSDRQLGSFLYMAGIPIDYNYLYQPQLKQTTIPENTYVVFRITLGNGPSHPQIAKAIEEIWKIVTLDPDMTPTPDPDFEVYDRNFRYGTSGSIVNYYMPIRM